ncbi:MAG: aminopeptidase P family N-terminal domain-containing protein, partial [Paralcaligenes sp.]
MVNSVFAQRIAALRAAMSAQKIDACIVPSSDPHSSEYLPEHWQARSWLSGFDGSAGTLVVTAQFAGVWTDSRYWVQAEQVLAGTGIQTVRAGADGVLGYIDWLATELPRGSRVSVDGQVVNIQAYRQWQADLGQKGIVLLTDQDLVDTVWPERSPLPVAAVYEHVAPFACRSRVANLAAVRAAMAEHKADWHWVSSLDDIAWIFNLRGNDVSYNPVFLAHALIGRDTACLFVAPEKIDAALRATLSRDGVQIEPYAQAAAALAALPEGQV